MRLMSLFKKNKTIAFKDSKIKELCDKYDLEKQIKKDLLEQNTKIESIYIDENEIAIKFIEQDRHGRYEVTPEDLLNLCKYLGSFNYLLYSDYGVCVKFNIKDVDTVDMINILKVINLDEEVGEE